jgi:proteasome lid subunit RPN8/RPN11
MWASRRIARRLFSPRAKLRFGHDLWTQMIAELAHRGGGNRESGAFLLAECEGDQRVVSEVVYFDDLDPECLVGAIHLHRSAYPRLWDLCAREQMRVVADVHTHPGTWVGQSSTDRENPMIAIPGHIGLIVPDYALGDPSPAQIGFHLYEGDEGWRSHFDKQAAALIYVGRWP